MELTLAQTDALTELLNMSYGRVDGALSELIGHQITLEMSQLAIHDLAEVGPILESTLGPAVASVNQVFSGFVSGNALLVLDEQSALLLSHLLGAGAFRSRAFDANAREMLTEVGDIFLNSCLGVVGDLLHLQIHFAGPRTNFDKANRLFASLDEHPNEPLSYGMMIRTRFTVTAGTVTGFLVIVLGLASLARLLHDVEAWENRQVR